MSGQEKDPKQSALEQENQALQERIAQLERQLARRSKVRRKVTRSVTGVFFGRNLRDSVSQLVDELSARQISRQTVKDVVYAFLKRMSRVGMVWLLVALGPLVLAVLQTYYLKKQNEKLDAQNRRIEQQTFLQEAERRSSLVFLFDNVLDKMDEELRGKLRQEDRHLSPQLIGRIVALSIALKPYRYLEEDSITARPYSQERGQLLMSLVISKLSRNTYDQIFAAADFSYATLRHINLNDAYMRYIQMQHAVLENVSLVGADLSYADFTSATLYKVTAFLKNGNKPRGAVFDGARFSDAEIAASDLSGSSFKSASFTRARLRNAYLEDALFSNTEFFLPGIDSVSFRRSQFNGSMFAGNSAGTGRLSLQEAFMDTSTWNTLHRGVPGLNSRLQLDQPRYRIRFDTPYIDIKGRLFVVADSLTLFPVRE